jgi:hypothetical protein
MQYNLTLSKILMFLKVLSLIIWQLFTYVCYTFSNSSVMIVTKQLAGAFLEI